MSGGPVRALVASWPVLVTAEQKRAAMVGVFEDADGVRCVGVIIRRPDHLQPDALFMGRAELDSLRAALDKAAGWLS